MNSPPPLANSKTSIRLQDLGPEYLLVNVPLAGRRATEITVNGYPLV